MSLVSGYSSSDSEDEKLPSIPDEIVNKFARKPKLAKTDVVSVTSFVYLNWKLSSPQLIYIKNMISSIPGAGSLIYDEDLKIYRDLHISLSYNFKLADTNQLEELIRSVQSVGVPKFDVEFDEQLVILPSQTTNKKFLLLPVKQSANLVQLVRDINKIIAQYSTDYMGYDPAMVHCSIAECDTAAAPQIKLKGLSVHIDKVYVSKGRSVLSVPLTG